MFIFSARMTLGLALLASCLTLTSCGEPTIDEEAARGFASQWAPSVAEHLREQAGRAAASQALKERLSQYENAGNVPLPDGEPPFDSIIYKVYAGRDFAPGLVDDTGLTELGRDFWEILQDLDAHRLDPEPYAVDTIADAKERFTGQRAGIADFDALEATADDQEAAIAWLIGQPQSQFELVAENYPLLTDILLEENESGSRMRQALNAYGEARAELATTGAELEYLMARALARYIHEQRHHRIKEIFVHPRHWDYYNEADVENAGPRPDSAKGPFRAGQVWRHAAHLTEAIAKENTSQILNDKIAQTLQDLLNSDSPSDAVHAIAPQQPQYAGLVAEYKRYRQIVEEGGWEAVPRQDIKPGQNHPTARALKERLQIEGYYPADAPLDDAFDEALTQAISIYQKTHQLNVTGRPHNVFWQSLNVSAERRLAQIGLNIQRWRETNIDHNLSEYAFVNVPEFTIKVYQNQELIAEHASVVGTNEHSINPLTNEAEYINRTPTPYAAYIDRIIYNPYWNVTDRIRIGELLPQVHASLEQKYALRLYNLRERAFGPVDYGQAQAQNTNLEIADDSSPTEIDPEEERRCRVERAYNSFSEVRPFVIEIGDIKRTVRRRFFKISEVERIGYALHGGDEDAYEKFRKSFTYLDWETGLVNAERTNMENVPSWYEENGYDVVQIGNWEYIRELPGPKNALGKVKIIFPNYDIIYLHDTPAKSLFNSPVRSFSHGCIRIQDPLSLAETLLRLGKREDFNPQKVLDEEIYYPVFLKRQIPIYLEYYTVSVDEEGRANFLADIYRFDTEALADGT